MLAMNLAKIKHFPDSNDEGITGLPKLVSFCSEQAHYSAIKNSALLGFGAKNVISVKCDDRGKMIPEELERHVKEVKEAVCIVFIRTEGPALSRKTNILGLHILFVCFLFYLRINLFVHCRVKCRRNIPNSLIEAFTFHFG